MKKLLIIALLGAMGGLVSAAPSEGPATRPTTQPSTRPTTQPAQAINKFCAVDTDTPIDPSVTVVYKGKVIGFCCEDCVKEFKKDPEKYMAKLK